VDYDSVTSRFAKVDPNLDRFLTAIQKRNLPPCETDTIVRAVRQLFEPWKIDPARVSYHLHKEIGAGGFGRVFKGKLDNCPVAVKVVNVGLLDANIDLRPDFLREASLLSSVQHPCIVVFLGAYWPGAKSLARACADDSSSDGDEHDGCDAGGGNSGQELADPSRAFIVMELMSCNLEQAQRRYTLYDSEVRQALCDVTEALRSCTARASCTWMSRLPMYWSRLISKLGA
jgi:serine/threonine protein kinase